MKIMFTNQIYKLRNESLKMKEWAQKYRDRGITVDTLRDRWKKGWRGDKLFQTIYRDTENLISYAQLVSYDAGNGVETKNLRAWGEQLGINPKTLAHRYMKGDRGNILFRGHGIHRKAMLLRPETVIE
jgi:hypothetical protein